jgi:glutathione synthase/RimK-type ligase-like ATP-grasp enzyme
MSLKVLYCLHRLGIQTDVIDVGIPSITRFSRYRRRYASFVVEPGAAHRLAEFLNDYAERNKIEAVIGGDIDASGMLYAAARELRHMAVFPGSSLDTLEMLDDKWRFQQFMEANDIPCPRSMLLDDIAQLDDTRRFALRFPIVIKPLHGESSHGIVLASDVAAIVRHVTSGSRYASLPLLIQEYAPGYDADMSVLAQDGTVVAHVMHSRTRGGCALNFVHNPAVLAIVTKIVRAARYTGVANFDVRIDESDGRVRVLECNPRFWYTLQASLWRGLNFVAAGLAVARGEVWVAEAPVGGTYYLHGCLLKRILLNPANWRSIERYNFAGLWQALSDPWPFIGARLSR